MDFPKAAVEGVSSAVKSECSAHVEVPIFSSRFSKGKITSKSGKYFIACKVIDIAVCLYLVAAGFLVGLGYVCIIYVFFLLFL